MAQKVKSYCVPTFLLVSDATKRANLTKLLAELFLPLAAFLHSSAETASTLTVDWLKISRQISLPPKCSGFNHATNFPGTCET